MKPKLKMALMNPGDSFKVFVMVLLGLVAMLIGSCKKEKFEPVQVDAAALNVMNASPGQLAINFFLDNQFVNGPALLFTQQSGYIITYAGTRKFDVTIGGTTSVLANAAINLEKDKYFTAFFTGTNSSHEIVLISDDLSAPPAGKANIRFINLSPDSKALNLAIKDGAILFTGIAFKAATEFISVDPDVYSFELRSGENGSTELPSHQLVAGKVYTLWAKGLLTGSGSTEFTGHLTTNR